MTDTTVAPATPVIDTAQGLALLAMFDANAASYARQAKKLREVLTQQIGERYTATGEKYAADVRIPGTRTKVGSVSTSVTQDATVVEDMDALVAWALTTMPGEVEVKTSIRSSTLAALLANVEWGPNPEDPDGPAVATRIDDKGEAQVVPGLAFRAGGRVSSFSIRSRQDRELLDYIREVGLENTVKTANRLIEGVSTHSGEVVPGEVVEDAAAETPSEAPAEDAA